jgi:hypothetical protein
VVCVQMVNVVRSKKKGTAQMKLLRRLGVGIAMLLCAESVIFHAQSPPPDWDFPTNLNSWSFDDITNWTSDLGYPPISFTNTVGTQSAQKRYNKTLQFSSFL